MAKFGDLRNKECIELARASGGFVSEVPEGWFDNPNVWMEAKRDDVRISLQFDTDRNWAISRNREDKLKGVDKAGDFCDKSERLPHLCKRLILPNCAGLLLDGGISERGHAAGGRGASVAHLLAENPTALIYTAWDLLFDVGGKDVRTLPQRKRRHLLEQRVAEIGSPDLQVAEVLPATKETLDRIMKDGWEGGVLKRGDAIYRETHAWYKAKGESPIDAIVLNYIPEKRGGSPKKGIKATPTGRIGGFYMAMKSRATGKIVPVGHCLMGLTDEMKDVGTANFAKEFKGKIAECSASGWDGESFRWLIFKRWHPEQDKACILEEQLENLKKSGVEAEA